jgi:hypothetical protein
LGCRHRRPRQAANLHGQLDWFRIGGYFDFAIGLIEAELLHFETQLAGRQARQLELSGFIGPTDPAFAGGWLHHANRSARDGDSAVAADNPRDAHSLCQYWQGEEN